MRQPPLASQNRAFVALQVAHRILSLTAEYMELVKRFPAPMVSIKGVSQCFFCFLGGSIERGQPILLRANIKTFFRQQYLLVAVETGIDNHWYRFLPASLFVERHAAFCVGAPRDGLRDVMRVLCDDRTVVPCRATQLLSLSALVQDALPVAGVQS